MINEAFAQTSTGQAGGMDLVGLLPLVLMFVLLYFLMREKNKKLTKKHATL